MAPQTLVLKLGAQVMLLKNMDNGLVNGSVGKVIAFKAKSEMIDEDDPDYVDAEEEKAMKKTKDKWKREYSREPSAAPSANDEGDDTKPVRKANLNEEKHPVVEWKLPGGGTLKMRMMREEFKLEDMGKVKARRKQVS
jgi:ATP-dependent DNA helicase PIF1